MKKLKLRNGFDTFEGTVLCASQRHDAPPDHIQFHIGQIVEFSREVLEDLTLTSLHLDTYELDDLGSRLIIRLEDREERSIIMLVSSADFDWL